MAGLSLKAQAYANTKDYRQDMTALKKFFKKSERKGLYRHLKKLNRADLNKIMALHDEYDIPTDYMTKSKALLSKKKTTWKERRQDKRESSWQLRELRAFLIKNQIIEYTPGKGYRIDGGGVRVAF